MARWIRLRFMRLQPLLKRAVGAWRFAKRDGRMGLFGPRGQAYPLRMAGRAMIDRDGFPPSDETPTEKS